MALADLGRRKPGALLADSASGWRSHAPCQLAAGVVARRAARGAGSEAAPGDAARARHIQGSVGISSCTSRTTREEALAMSDRLAVQRGADRSRSTPAEVYERAGDAIRRGLVGTSNLLADRKVDGLTGGPPWRSAAMDRVARVDGTRRRPRHRRGPAGEDPAPGPAEQPSGLCLRTRTITEVVYLGTSRATRWQSKMRERRRTRAEPDTTSMEALGARGGPCGRRGSRDIPSSETGRGNHGRGGTMRMRFALGAALAQRWR
jgi:hypothetical protein